MTTPVTGPGAPPALPDPAQRRRVVFVLGTAQAGAGTLTHLLQTLGMHVPETDPEAQAGADAAADLESPWVADLHAELLRRSNVAVDDARPSAWYDAGKLATIDPLRTRLHTWLEAQFQEGGPELVVSDPALGWFLGLWRSAALRCDASPGYVTMLHPVTELVGSVREHLGSPVADVDRTAAWLNTTLHTERYTRGSARAFVRHPELLQDWTVPVFAVGQQFDVEAVKAASVNAIRRAHGCIGPDERRAQPSGLTWDDVHVPPRLRDIARQAWESLDRLAEPGGDTPAEHEVLDQVREAYVDLYEEAEALTRSSAEAARREGGPSRRGDSAPVPDRLADRVPHGMRAMVPASARRGLRRALGKER